MNNKFAISLTLQTDLKKYPIGRFSQPEKIDTKTIVIWFRDIKDFPKKLVSEIDRLSPFDLQKTYRPNGWNIIQIVCHCTDSHINSFIRFKLALTENHPTIKPYNERLWAELPDANTVEAIYGALQTLNGLHARWVKLLKSLRIDDLNRTF